MTLGKILILRKVHYEKLKKVRYQDVYHKALCYCLGISVDTRRNINSIYDFKTGCVKTECLHEGWQTSGSMKVVRMAFNLYCNGTPSVDDYTKNRGTGKRVQAVYSGGLVLLCLCTFLLAGDTDPLSGVCDL